MPSHAGIKREPIPLVNGSDLTKSSSFVMDGKEYAQYEGCIANMDLSDVLVRGGIG